MILLGCRCLFTSFRIDIRIASRNCLGTLVFRRILEFLGFGTGRFRVLGVFELLQLIRQVLFAGAGYLLMVLY